MSWRAREGGDGSPNDEGLVESFNCPKSVGLLYDMGVMMASMLCDVISLGVCKVGARPIAQISKSSCKGNSSLSDSVELTHWFSGVD